MGRQCVPTEASLQRGCTCCVSRLPLPPGHRDCLLRQLLHPPVYCLQFDESIRAGHSGKPACSDMMGGLSYWDWIGLPENKWRCAAVDELAISPCFQLAAAAGEIAVAAMVLLPAACIAAVLLRSCITSSQPSCSCAGRSALMPPWAWSRSCLPQPSSRRAAAASVVSSVGVPAANQVGWAASSDAQRKPCPCVKTFTPSCFPLPLHPWTQDYPWSSHASATVMDVGGGLGGILAALLERHPSMSGILFDRSAP